MQKMDNRSDIPTDFYGEPSYWFMITTLVFGIIIVLSNLLLLQIALCSSEIRSLLANYFVMNLAVGNILTGFFYVFLQPFVLIFGEHYRILCKICGFVNILSAMSFLLTPALIGACRFYTVTRLNSTKYNWFIQWAFFTKPGALTLLGSLWAYTFVFCFTLLYFDQLGEDPNGFCAAKAFDTFLLYLLYNAMITQLALGTAWASFIYYSRLRNFLNEYSAPFDRQFRDTRAVMQLLAITATLPLLCQSPALILSGGQWLLPDLPMWLKRALVLPCFIPSMVDPWCTMLLLNSFKTRLNRHFDARFVVHSATTVLNPELKPICAS